MRVNKGWNKVSLTTVDAMRYTGTYTQGKYRSCCIRYRHKSPRPSQVTKAGRVPQWAAGAQMAPYVSAFILSGACEGRPSLSATQISGIFLSVDSIG